MTKRACRRAHAPAYYLGRPAAFWATAFDPATQSSVIAARAPWPTVRSHSSSALDQLIGKVCTPHSSRD